MVVDRQETSQYYVSLEQYPEENYPHYCASYFMLMHSDIVQEYLVGYHKDITPASVHLFTVYLGLLGEKINMKYIDGE